MQCTPHGGASFAVQVREKLPKNRHFFQTFEKIREIAYSSVQFLRWRRNSKNSGGALR